MNKNATGKEKTAGYIYYVARISALLLVFLIFFPAFNPAKICGYVNKNMSLFGCKIFSDFPPELSSYRYVLQIRIV